MKALGLGHIGYRMQLIALISLVFQELGPPNGLCCAMSKMNSLLG